MGDKAWIITETRKKTTTIVGISLTHEATEIAMRADLDYGTSRTALPYPILQEKFASMTPQEAIAIVEECIDHGGHTRWEESFLVSLSDKLSHGPYRLSETEEDTLKRIQEKMGK